MEIHFVIELSTEPLLPPLKQETREKKIIVKFLTALLANEKVIISNIGFVMVGKVEPLVRVLLMVSWAVFENNVFSKL